MDIKELELKNLTIKNLMEQIEKNDRENAFLKRKLKEREALVKDTLQYCSNVLNMRSYKIMQMLFKMFRQGILGSISEKRYFYGLCKKFFLGNGGSAFLGDDKYNYVKKIVDYFNVLANYECVLDRNRKAIDLGSVNNVTEEWLDGIYDKVDVIVLSVINYNFRFQRPQHFAKKYAESGHRVFYVNPDFCSCETVYEEKENLFLVSFFDAKYSDIYKINNNDTFASWANKACDKLVGMYAIQDAIVIIDYPNWMPVALHLKDKYGFALVADHMDDTTGFLHTVSDTLKANTLLMLKLSDMVISSSEFLNKLAIQHNDNVALIRNGTEFNHFLLAYNESKKKKKKVIGYYGAISHWFDWEKVCFLAENIPECEIVLIGEVLEYENVLSKYSNIKMLGEKNYRELPQYLVDFDVCLIPFDTSTNLIKATNPVKFYEYLSAGKKIVATDIPELKKYQDKYLYMTNDTKEFYNYVLLCLNDKDSLLTSKECIDFAEKNDWVYRYKDFCMECIKAVPKVSVIILTYNNLNLNKICIDSVLKKTAYPNYELIIVDNASSDGTVKYLEQLNKEKHNHVKIILNKENLGFAAGNNVGILHSSGKYVVLLNNDTVVTRGWLTNLVKHMEKDEKCGMVGAVTNSIGNEAMIAVKYRNLQELEKFAYLYTLLHRNEITCNVDRLALFCTIIRKSLIEKVGMLDEIYKVGMFEDDDYALLVKSSGHHFYVAEDVFIHHVNNASFKKLHPEAYKKIFNENKRIYEEKWKVKWKMPKYRQGVTANINDDMMHNPI